MVIFLTDGLPTVGETNDAKITAEARALSRPRGVRLFDFGVGYDVDVHFLDRLAEANKGDSDYVRPEEDIEAKVSRFYKKIASPVLTDVQIEIAGVSTANIYPRLSELPDLFAGSQLLIAGRYTGSGPVNARLLGNLNGKRVAYELSTALPAVADANDFLPRLWATRKIGYLLDAIRLHGTEGGGGADDPELVGEIVRLSKEYGVITPYTSFLVTENGEETPINRPIIGADLFGTHRARRIYALPAPQAFTQQFATASGANATTQSEALHAYKSAGTVNGLAGFSPGEAKDARQNIRTAGAKTFLLQNGVWTDSAYDPAKQKPLITVLAYSDAHFALLRALPSLAACSSLGENLLVVLDNGQALKISAGTGLKTLAAGELTRLTGR